METLRFLMVTTFYPPYHLGGDAVHVQYLARALAARGHEVHVEFSPAAYALKRPGRPPPPPDPDDGVTLHAIPGEGLGSPIAAHVLGRSASVSRFHARLTAETRPDVIHHHNISLLGLGVLGPRPRVRSLYTAHDYWVRCPRSDLFKYGKRPCETPACLRCALVSRRPPQLWRYAQGWRGLPGVDVAIAPSAYMADAIRPSLGCPVVHIPNFAPDPDQVPAENGGDPYYLFVGVLEAHKGVPELADASRRRGFAVRIVGRGSLYARLKHMENGGTSGPRLEGWVPRNRLLGLYRGARALLVPSLWPENAPLAAVEALACGTPLLVSRRGGLEELLHGGRTGFSFDPEADGIGEAVTRLEEDPHPQDRRAAARNAYLEHHHPDAYVRRYLEIVRNGSAPVGVSA